MKIIPHAFVGASIHSEILIFISQIINEITHSGVVKIIWHSFLAAIIRKIVNQGILQPVLLIMVFNQYRFVGIFHKRRNTNTSQIARHTAFSSGIAPKSYFQFFSPLKSQNLLCQKYDCQKP
jgi:hypothetical protein